MKTKVSFGDTLYTAIYPWIGLHGSYAFWRPLARKKIKEGITNAKAIIRILGFLLS